jgi:subtilisin family serine protease
MKKIIILFGIFLLASCGGGGGGSSASSVNNNGFAVSTISSGAGDLTSYLWHLNNTGNSNDFFSLNAGVNGEDINMGAITQTGTGIIVAVVDDGLEITHEDLKDNVVAGGSYDFTDGDTNPTLITSNGGHGTSVAGLIAASNNSPTNIGGKGVAPNAKLKGFNLLKDYSISNTTDALGDAAYAQNVAIFNQSYGYGTTYDFPINSTIESQMIDSTTNLRGGKGAIFVKSAGNGFDKITNNGVVIFNCNSYLNRPNLTCQNSNMDPSNTIPYNIVVGAVNADGKKSSYSTAGSSIWIASTGGEYGITKTAMLTTDQSGCDRGYSKLGATKNAFEDNSNGDNPSCNYTSVFNGTSSAAPVLSGVVALMLEANPNLTWRDVKHILATTAEKIDASIATTTIVIGGGNYDAEPAWLTNTAGYNFHNYYGFGRVDAARAVASATSYVLGSLGTWTISSWENKNVGFAVPDDNVNGITSTIATVVNKTIEAVQIKVDIAHTYTGELAIELTSSSSTKSVLFNPYNAFSNDENLDMVLTTNAFYGENSQGTWTIKVIDSNSGDIGTLNNWQIRFFGH